jgi:MHS family alpha-ketoglutarate permease-like MFS transporter
VYRFATDCCYTYESIGVFAPLLLVIARLIQGLSVGGEYGASATYLSEMAEKDRRGFFSSFQYVTLIAGQLTALCVLLILQMILTEEQLHDWGWRVPFFIGALLAIVVFRIRRGLLKLNPLKTLKQQISRNQECLLYLNIILKRPSLYYS